MVGDLSVTVNGVTETVTPDPDTGVWSLDWPTVLAEGNHTVSVSGADADGNPASASDSFAILLTIALVAPTDLALVIPPLDGALVDLLNTLDGILSPVVDILDIDLSPSTVSEAVDLLAVLDDDLLGTVGSIPLVGPPVRVLLEPVVDTVLTPAITGLTDYVNSLLDSSKIIGISADAASVELLIIQDGSVLGVTPATYNVDSDGSFEIPLGGLNLLLGDVGELLFDGLDVTGGVRAIDSDGSVSETVLFNLGDKTQLLADPVQALGELLGTALGDTSTMPLIDSAFIGTDGDNVFVGDGNADVMSGFQMYNAGVDDGNDTLIGRGGADTLSGGTGDDYLSIADADFAMLEGGPGDDTLALSGTGIVLDFVAGLNPVTDIERIDLTGQGDNAVVLDEASVLGLTDTNNILLIDGNDDDVAQLDNFAASGTTPG